MKNIWNTLKKPIMILAPMDDVTDSAFRRLVAETAKPDLFFTEFTNVEGIFSEGNKTVRRKLYFTPVERPLIAQLWGMDPKHYEDAAKLVVQMGFDGIDINMGCPERSIMKKGCCAALINNPEHAKKIIDAVKKGADGKLPISVKTRIGVNEIKTEEWISFLLEQDLDALIVHGRTAKEMSAVPSHWDEIGKVVQLRDRISPKTVIIGNGDIKNLSEAQEKVEKYGVDGVMIGRGIFENVWLFDPEKALEEVTLKERLTLLLRHMALFEETWKGEKNFQILKKFFKIYVKGFEGASEVRVSLMEAKTSDEVKDKVKLYM
jgi:nifR3 family TIM-barrel protein